MKKQASPNVKKIVEAIYILSLAEMLHRRLVMQKLENLLVKNCIPMCDSKYNPPS